MGKLITIYMIYLGFLTGIFATQAISLGFYIIALAIGALGFSTAGIVQSGKEETDKQTKESRKYLNVNIYGDSFFSVEDYLEDIENIESFEKLNAKIELILNDSDITDTHQKRFLELVSAIEYINELERTNIESRMVQTLVDLNLLTLKVIEPFSVHFFRDSPDIRELPSEKRILSYIYKEKWSEKPLLLKIPLSILKEMFTIEMALNCLDNPSLKYSTLKFLDLDQNTNLQDYILRSYTRLKINIHNLYVEEKEKSELDTQNSLDKYVDLLKED